MMTQENIKRSKFKVSIYALLFLTILLGLSVLLEGCGDVCRVTREYTYYEPVYATMDEIRAQITLEEPQQINAVGKIYFKDALLYVNEPGEGIHIINNANPSSPVPLRFLKVPGNYDLAIKGNILYADSYVDLIAFDISDINNIREVNRLEGVFRNYSVMNHMIDAECCVITDFVERKTISRDESECGVIPVSPWSSFWFENGLAVANDASASFSSKAAVAPGSGSGSGVGGSMARFTINGNHLYMLDGADLQVVDVTNETDPTAGSRSTIAWDIETIFPYKSNLFIGSNSGMHIMDVSNPASPSRISTYEHLRSCDPVVVDDQYAYVTLRSGTMCQGFTNQLEVIDIQDLKKPTLLETYPMHNPHGLGIDENTLFICDGSDGLKAFDASDITKIDQRMLAHYKNIHALDVIPLDNVLMMIGEDGIYQFDYADPKNIKILSKINVSHEE